MDRQGAKDAKDRGEKPEKRPPGGADLRECDDDSSEMAALRRARGLRGPASVSDAGADAGPSFDPACDNTDPTHCLLPWPSDHFARTGRVALPASAMPVSARGEAIDPAPFAREGFSLLPAPMTVLPVTPDEASLAGEDRVADSLGPDATAVIVNVATGARVPCFAELDRWRTSSRIASPSTCGPPCGSSRARATRSACEACAPRAARSSSPRRSSARCATDRRSRGATWRRAAAISTTSSPRSRRRAWPAASCRWPGASPPRPRAPSRPICWRCATA
ncbi:MAG: hypothetical protein M5U28_38710 [Sandaracinaceae bacterium]|nr:hypothetical protein [Sandaracinaceae bacterium]